MRAFFALLALSGVAGVAFGILTIISGRQAGVPFSYENYGGPGSIIGGVALHPAHGWLTDRLQEAGR